MDIVGCSMSKSSIGWEELMGGAKLDPWKTGDGVMTHELSEQMDSPSQSGLTPWPLLLCAGERSVCCGVCVCVCVCVRARERV